MRLIDDDAAVFDYLHDTLGVDRVEDIPATGLDAVLAWVKGGGA